MGAEGVKWVTGATEPALTRYHGAPTTNGSAWVPTQAAATSYFNAIAPWGMMGRVSMRPDGSVASRCPINQTSLQVANNWGDYCYADTNADNNGEQKMVYVPQFCAAVDTLTANQTWFWIGQVGDTFRLSNDSADYTFVGSGTGYNGGSNGDIHPAFIVDGVAKSGAYIGAYEAYYDGTKLNSCANVAPTVSVTKPNFRTYAENIGTGWELMTTQAVGMLQFLFMVEYASLNSQQTLGCGFTNNSAMQPTGTTVSYGNASWGHTGTAGADYAYGPVSYRGVENIYGNMFQFVEGIRSDAGATPAIWVAPQTALHTYSDTSTLTTTGADGSGTTVGAYTNTGSAIAAITSASGSGIWETNDPNGLWWAAIGNNTTGGGTGSYICDKIGYAASCVYMFGNSWMNWSDGGIFNLTSVGTTGSTQVGVRLQYFPS